MVATNNKRYHHRLKNSNLREFGITDTLKKPVSWAPVKQYEIPGPKLEDGDGFRVYPGDDTARDPQPEQCACDDVCDQCGACRDCDDCTCDEEADE